MSDDATIQPCVFCEDESDTTCAGCERRVCWSHCRSGDDADLCDECVAELVAEAKAEGSEDEAPGWAGVSRG